MKFKFVKIENNELIYKANKVKINDAFKFDKITDTQMNILNSNNTKWHNTCHHQGLLGTKENKVIFVPRTSYDYKLTRTRTLDQLKANSEIFNEKTVEFYRFNDICNIGSLKWILGNDTDNIKVQNLEDRSDIVSRLVGKYEDFEYFKEWVANTDLDEFDISPYFNIDNTIDELHFSNITNNIKDE